MPTLRAYQRDLVERGFAALVQHRSRVMLQLPTGAGKTVVAGAMVSRWLQNQPVARVVWLTHRIELRAQSADRLRKDFGLIVESGGERWKTNAPAPSVTGGVCLLQAQTVVRRLDQMRSIWQQYGPNDLLVVDEAHHAPARGWERAIAIWPGRTLGLTATPWRITAHQGFEEIFSILICGPQIAELQRDGFLANSRTFTPPREDRIIGKIGDNGADFTDSEIEESNAPVVMTTKAVRFWQRLARERQTIVYAVSTRHAHNLADEFEKNDVAAAVILADTPAIERESAVEGFKAADIRVLVNVMVATEGVDMPDASCIVVTRPTKSLSLFLQMIGRGLRPKRNRGDCIILDLAGNSELHGVPETKRVWSLAPRSERRDGDPPVVRCRVCGFMAHPSYHRCPECDADMGKACVRCGRFRLWKRWSQEIVCDHCFHDLTAEVEISTGESLSGQIIQAATTEHVSQTNDETALLALYHATGGPTWNRHCRWATDSPLHEWYGVSVDSQGRVIRLDLACNGMVGKIPDTLGSLQKLSALDLSGNSLSGSIPNSLGGLTDLRWLDLSDNQLVGPIPASLGHLSELNWLRLQDNCLEGLIPSELGGLHHLETLRLSNNLLTGPLPELLARFGSGATSESKDGARGLGGSQKFSRQPRLMGRRVILRAS